VLECVGVCCSVLQRVAMCCSVLQFVAVCCSVLQCVALCCSVLQRVALRTMTHKVNFSEMPFLAFFSEVSEIAFLRRNVSQLLRNLSS